MYLHFGPLQRVAGLLCWLVVVVCLVTLLLDDFTNYENPLEIYYLHISITNIIVMFSAAAADEVIPILILTLIARNESIKLLTQTLGSAPNVSKWIVKDSRQSQNPIIQKLCDPSEDIVDLTDSEDYDHGGIVCNAMTHADGLFLSRFTLGRSKPLGIVWTALSRTACDVELSRNKEDKIIAKVQNPKQKFVHVDGKVLFDIPGKR